MIHKVLHVNLYVVCFSNSHRYIFGRGGTCFYTLWLREEMLITFALSSCWILCLYCYIHISLCCLLPTSVVVLGKSCLHFPAYVHIHALHDLPPWTWSPCYVAHPFLSTISVFCLSPLEYCCTSSMLQCKLNDTSLKWMLQNLFG